MSRTHLLGAVSAAALSCLSTGAFAQHSAITGGGSTLAEFDYFAEFALFDNSVGPNDALFFNPPPAQGNNAYYWPAGSGSGQAAFLNDDLTCDANKVTGANGGACSNTPGGQNAVDYGASDATFSSTQEQQWASSAYGQAAAGNLIQLPSMGVGVSFPIRNSAVTSNGQITLTDNDLCGIFSGKITDWSKTSAAGSLAAGAITVAYRSDGSGTSFLLLNHFAAAKVCTASNSNFAFPIVVGTTFASAFSGGVVPANFVGEKGSQALATYLSTAPSATGYLSPDYTTIDPNSDATLSDGSKSNLVVAAVLNATTKTAFTPTVANITSALLKPALGTHLTPPTNASAGANPDNYVPLIQTVKTGYPVVGYTTFDFAQCYASPIVATGIIKYLKLHSANSAYTAVITRNGFVPVGKSGASRFVAVINNDILANKSGWNDNIENATACSGLAGR